MKKQSLLSWAVFTMLIFSITSCNDSLQFDPKVNCSDCNDVSLRSNKIGSSPSLLSADVWEPVANFPGQKIGAVSFTIFEKSAYVGTGFNRDPISSVLTRSRDFWNYDPTNNVWTQIADFGGQARTYAAAFAIGGKGYVGTGDGNTFLKDFWEYNPSTNQWTQRADFGGLARIGAVGLAIGSKGYIGTGTTNSGAEKDFWEYNPTTNLWTKKADYSGKPRTFAGGFVIDKTGFLGAGFTNNIAQLDFWQYYPAIDIWKERASLGGNSNPGHSGFFSLKSKGYVGGNGQLWMYDPTTNIWVRKADFPGSMNSGVGFSALGLYGYIGIGNYPDPGNFSAFYKYTPD
jgi:N-acetylneuraminic acid mutarotase